ncbi:MAG: hypothetical protein ABL962_18410 [Fimbriimonadaceae bacterium]
MTYQIPREVEVAFEHCFKGELAALKTRYKSLLKVNPHALEALDISMANLFVSYVKKEPGAEALIRKVLGCKSSDPCFQIFCPFCRIKKQKEAASKALLHFDSIPNEKIKFATILLPLQLMGTDAYEAQGKFRKRLANLLRNHAKALGPEFRMMGAFEIDLKNLGTHADASRASRKLMVSLGFNEKRLAPQFLPHLHAIIGPLDSKQARLFKRLVEKALGHDLFPRQVVCKSLYKKPTKEQNLKKLGPYRRWHRRRS